MKMSYTILSVIGILVVAVLFSGCGLIEVNVQKYFYPSYWEAKSLKKKLSFEGEKPPYSDEYRARLSTLYATALSYYDLDPNDWEQMQNKLVPRQFSDGVYYSWELAKDNHFIKDRIALKLIRITFRTPNPSNIDDIYYILAGVRWYNDTFRIRVKAGTNLSVEKPEWEFVE